MTSSAQFQLDNEKNLSEENNLITLKIIDARHHTSKETQLKRRIIELLANSSAHGIPNIMREKRNWLKAIWLSFLVASTFACSFYTITSVTDYTKYNTITTIKLINEQNTQFPTITLCAYPPFNATIEQTITVARFEKVTLNLRDFFEEFNDVRFGKCFRFNSGRNSFNKSISLQNSTKKGFLYGLILNIHLDVPDDYDFGEILVNIHNFSSPPYEIENQGFWTKTGSWNHYGVERVFTEQLGEPYNSCLKNVSLFDQNKTIIDYILKSNRIYTQSDCFYQCSHLYALEESKSTFFLF